MLLMENSFSKHYWYAASSKPRIYQETKLLVLLSVVKFVYAFSEPYRPKRLSVAILALALVLALVAPGTVEPG